MESLPGLAAKKKWQHHELAVTTAAYGWLFHRPITYDEFLGLYYNSKIKLAWDYWAKTLADSQGTLPLWVFEALAETPEEAKKMRSENMRQVAVAQVMRRAR